MTQANASNRKSIADMIIKWLEEYGFTYKITLSPNLFIYLKVEFGKDRFIHITMNNNEYSLSIFAIIDLLDLDKKAFSSLDESEKCEFFTFIKFGVRQHQYLSHSTGYK